jgi:hypothetical protein
MSKPAVQADSAGAIWTRIIRPDEGNLSRAAAEALLQLHFAEPDLRRMHALAERNQAGTLSAAEAAELERYREVGLELDLVHAKARQALGRNAGQESAE